MIYQPFPFKRCLKCNEFKPFTAFVKNKRGSEQLRSHCRICNSIYDKQWRRNILPIGANSRGVTAKSIPISIAKKTNATLLSIGNTSPREIVNGEGETPSMCGSTAASTGNLIPTKCVGPRLNETKNIARSVPSTTHNMDALIVSKVGLKVINAVFAFVIFRRRSR